MAAAYTKEFLVNAFLSRYDRVVGVKLPALKNMAEQHYDTVGRDKFRVSAQLDAEAIKLYKSSLNCNK